MAPPPRVGDRLTTRLARDVAHPPLSVLETGSTPSGEVLSSSHRRERVAGTVNSRFARVGCALRTVIGPAQNEWLLIEWPKGEVEPTRLLALDVAAGQPLSRAAPAPWSGVRIGNSVETPKPDLEIRPLRGIHPQVGHDGPQGLHAEELHAAGLDRCAGAAV